MNILKQVNYKIVYINKRLFFLGMVFDWDKVRVGGRRLRKGWGYGVGSDQRLDLIIWFIPLYSGGKNSPWETI
jgi:hypothetical protein